MKYRKNVRKWVKDEKRIIKLAYRKGYLDCFNIKYFYWDGFKATGKRYKSRYSDYSFHQYYPEVFICEIDYWGEADDIGIVDWLWDKVYWDGVDMEEFNGVWPESDNKKYLSRSGLIEYLEMQPTVVHDSKINKVLKTSYF